MKQTFKVLAAVALLFTATLSAHAQFSSKMDNTIPDRFHMGIRGGMTINSYSGSDLYKSFLWPTGGIALDFQVAPFPLFVGIGLNYINYGCKIEGESSYYDSYSKEYYSYSYSHKVDKAHSIQMPVVVSYHINVAPNLFINPFIGEFMAYNTDDDFAEQFNYGLRVGCGLNFGRLTFDVGYDLGIPNLAKGYDDYYSKDYKRDFSSRTGTFFMTLGFNWAGSR